ncbi:MAG: tetratricopeptide repeat protein [Gemmataceae bacterium]
MPSARTTRKLQIAFTGKLASMTRAEAAALVHERGGLFQRGVSRDTGTLVVGQEGWPLQENGRLSRKLEKARRLQQGGAAVTIVTEEDWLAQLGLEGSTRGVHQRFSLAQLCRLLKLPRDRLRSWMRAGLVEPVDTVAAMPYFDFHQVTGVKTLWDLVRSGVPLERLRTSLEQLARWLPSLGHSLTQLQLLERGGQVLWRLDDGQLVDPTGQLQFDFAGDDNPAAALEREPASLTAERWRQEGVSLEEQGQAAEAAHAYRQALYVGGPNAEVCFNLGNVLYGLGQLGQAAERFWQAVELEHDFTEAWNNLGNVLLELGQVDEGLKAYRQALKITPAYADAHYNLADALDTLGRPGSARPHWKEYLSLEPLGPWADHARKRLAKAR